MRFVVEGPPVPKGRPRFSGHAFTPPRTRAYEHKVAWTATAAKPKPWPMDQRYRVSIVVCSATAHRTDIDNLAKCPIDACNKILWNDDSQIDDLRIVRVRDGLPRMEMEIQCL